MVCWDRTPIKNSETIQTRGNWIRRRRQEFAGHERNKREERTSNNQIIRMGRKDTHRVILPQPRTNLRRNDSKPNARIQGSTPNKTGSLPPRYLSDIRIVNLNFSG